MKFNPPYSITAQQLHDKWAAALSRPRGDDVNDRESIMDSLINDIILWISDQEAREKEKHK